MVRTVWLGLIFLIILAGVGSFRFAFGHFDVANASGIVRADGDRAAGMKVIKETLTDADRSPVHFTSPPSELDTPKASHTPTELVSRSVRAIEMPRIIGRHWHDPKSDTGSKQKHKNPSANADKSQAPAEPKACQLLEFDAIRLALGMPTGCHT